MAKKMPMHEEMTDKAILVPLDGSSVAAAALPYAQATARALRCSVRLLTVVQTRPQGPRARGPRCGTEDTGREAIERNLELAAETLRAQGVEAATTIVSGRSAEEIIAQASVDGIAMIVMATHGRGGIERWFIGSVADKVMRLSPRPILLVPSPGDPGATEISLTRLLLPLDGSALAEGALPLAVALAQGARASLVLAQMPPIPTTLMPVDIDYLEEFDDRELREAAQRYLDLVKRRLPASVHSETALLRGLTAASALADYARAQSVDLVIMSTHGRGGFSRFVLGSTADRLVRMGVPVLLIRPSGKERRLGAGSDQAEAQ